MGYNNGFISQTNNVTIPDVQKALGTSATNVVSLCQHPNIKKYPRRKPYAFGGILPNGLYGMNGTDESICEQNNFGMKPSLIALPKNDRNFSTDGCDPGWEQWRVPSGLRKAEAPSQAEDEPFRLADFRGYDVNAGPHIAKYEIFIDDKTTPFPYLQPAVNGKTKIKLTFNPVDWSVRLSDFKHGGVKLSDMYLTLLIANHRPYYQINSTSSVAEQWGERIVFKQSDKKLSEVIGTSSAANALELTLDTTNLSSATLSTFRNSSSAYGSSTKIFVAVGLAPKLPTTGNVTSFGNGYMVTANGVMPCDLVNFNMWNEKSWSVVRINDDFLANATGASYYYDVPCRISVTESTTNNSTTTASFDKTNKQIIVKLGGAFVASPNPTNIPANCRTEGHLGFAFGIYVSDGFWDHKQTYEVSDWYCVFTNKGVADQRSVKLENGMVIASQSDTSGLTATEQLAAADFLNMKVLPSDGLIKIKCPDALNYSKANITIFCDIEAYPSTNGADKFYPNITTRTDFPSATIEWEKTLDVSTT